MAVHYAPSADAVRGASRRAELAYERIVETAPANGSNAPQGLAKVAASRARDTRRQPLERRTQ